MGMNEHSNSSSKLELLFKKKMFFLQFSFLFLPFFKNILNLNIFEKYLFGKTSFTAVLISVQAENWKIFYEFDLEYNTVYTEYGLFNYIQ